MKTRYLIFILSGILITSLPNEVMGTIHQDPFYLEDKIDCDKKSFLLLNLLQKWQLNGVMQLDGDMYQTILLTYNDDWLIASIDSIPDELLPWKIEKITLNNVMWEAHLTDNCDRFIKWAMQLNDKD